MKDKTINTVIVAGLCVILWQITKELAGFENTIIIALATIYARI